MKKSLFKKVSNKIFSLCFGYNLRSIEEEINCLYYFLNNYVDITSLPPTKDEGLRKLQLCDVELLNIIDRICKKNNLTYWLDYGTLLGAVRHKGFIPWDDDMDITMPREDYNRFYSMKDELKTLYNIDVNINGTWIGVGYKHQKTGVWLDIFPADIYLSDLNYDDAKLKIITIKKKYKNAVRRLYKKETHLDIISKKIDKWFNAFQHGSKKIVTSGPDVMDSPIVQEKFVFPLKKIIFEGVEFNAPQNCDIYLSEIYSRSYMEFPHSGILHHGTSSGRLPLGDWAKNNNIDMDLIKQELCNIRNLL